ncbi:unnamed protein product [Phytophthora fragariaefolia]|uniref:Unnamed protein product n=1 Tax=Phytophthora fragariaefolia TaxID=1490495 RepID=A0A9W6WZI6_9STRA|nr:unnamed protein product [Phytophthora fragariaefolia]
MDGCTSHISLPVVDAAESLGIILVCLPANGTDLLQPQDVAVFSPFKTSVKLLLDKLLPTFGDVNVDKQTALGVAALAWNHACLSSNLVAGISSCGIFPLSRVNMHAKLANFGRNGLPNSHRDAAWLQVCHIVRREMLPEKSY